MGGSIDIGVNEGSMVDLHSKISRIIRKNQPQTQGLVILTLLHDALLI